MSQTSTKFCKDCTHFITVPATTVRGTPTYNCGKSKWEITNLVTGEIRTNYHTCYAMRNSDSIHTNSVYSDKGCGPKGTLFEPTALGKSGNEQTL